MLQENYITVKNILQLKNLCYNRREPFLGLYCDAEIYVQFEIIINIE